MISSIDRVLVRAAASSIARGRPSSERQRSCTASAVIVRSAPGAVGRRTTGEQLDRVGEREWRELEQRLTVDVERDLARAEDPQPGRGVEQADRRAPRPRRHVLAVVEDHEGTAASEPLEQRGLAAGHARARRSARRRPRRRSSRLRAGPASATASDALGASQHRPVAIATAVLPMPPGPTISTSRLVASSSAQRGRPPVAPDELGRHRRQVPGRRAGLDGPVPRPGGAEQRVVDEDLLLELPERGPGSRPSSSASGCADPLVGGERVGLASRAVQRSDQQLPEALLVRVAPRPPASSSPITSVVAPSSRSSRELGLDRAAGAPRRAGPGGVSTQSPSPADGSRSPRYMRQGQARWVGGARVVAGLEQAGGRGRSRRAP